MAHFQLPTQTGGDANSHRRHHKKVNGLSALLAVILRIGIVGCVPVIVIAVAIIPLISYPDPKIPVQTEGDQTLCGHSNVSAPRNCLAYRARPGASSCANCRAFPSPCDRAMMLPITAPPPTYFPVRRFAPTPCFSLPPACTLSFSVLTA